jgi:hypothetical protein
VKQLELPLGCSIEYKDGLWYASFESAGKTFVARGETEAVAASNLVALMEKYILRNYGPMTARQIAAELGLGTQIVRRFVKEYDEKRGAR